MLALADFCEGFTMNPIAERLLEKKILVLDGALATELEAKGCDLNHPLWSARVLLDEPQKIEEVHIAYLEAGADFITSSGYQASVPGFCDLGLTEKEARTLYLDSLRIAVRARESQGTRGDGALVAASIGPYGAYLADGSEYRGNYGIPKEELEAFHRDRIEMVVEESRAEGRGADVIAFETIPSLPEALILARILQSFPGVCAWMSFACRDGALTGEGQRIEECATALEDFPQIAAIGMNCTSPAFITPLVRRLASTTSRPIIVYPNSREGFDPVGKRWTGRRERSPDESIAEWVGAGARIVGGCCRTTPADIARMVHWRDGFVR